jgi:hypothetical protein
MVLEQFVESGPIDVAVKVPKFFPYMYRVHNKITSWKLCAHDAITCREECCKMNCVVIYKRQSLTMRSRKKCSVILFWDA